MRSAEDHPTALPWQAWSPESDGISLPYRQSVR